MSTSTPRPDTETRPGRPTPRPDPDRWYSDDAVTTENAPRTFDTDCTHRLPNPVSKANQSTPQ
ncbi:hypothetical protein [Halorarius halobius]|uniref:hypothetical protein n=1 Tax=Halorarius halobius TaxID=2962671 RepID=UPI0020CEFB3F|nr:hypothetical protein [Halorarius halobius]